jgi:probable HAF family extracellular repeat protein
MNRHFVLVPHSKLRSWGLLSRGAWLSAGVVAVMLISPACDSSGDDGAGSGGTPSAGKGGTSGDSAAGSSGGGGEAEAGASSGGEPSEAGTGGAPASGGSAGGGKGGAPASGGSAGGGKGGAPCQREYDVVDLGELPPDTNLTPAAINASGAVLVSGETRAGVYTNEMTDLGVLEGGGTKTFGMGMNDAGDVVGKAWLADIYAHSFLYRDGTLTQISEDLGEMTTGESIDINNEGAILARIDGRWAVYDGDVTFVPEDPAGSIGPVALNDSGVVVGNKIFDLTLLKTHAAKLEDGEYIDLGAPDEASTSLAAAINNAGDVVGTISGGDLGTANHAALFKDGDVIDLGTLPDYLHSGATAINDEGVIVGGLSSTTGSGNKAFVYACGEMVDLNTLIPDDADEWVLAGAYAINDAGQIAGFGNLNGVPSRRAFRLDPR